MTTLAVRPTTSPFDPDGRMLFDKPEHRYWLDDRTDQHELISVTRALEEGLQGSMGEEYWTEESRQRGTYVHEAILFHAEGDLDASTVHPIIAPYFGGYVDFLEEERPELLYVEQRVFDEPLGYAGTFDLLVKLNGRNAFRDKIAAGVEVLDLIDVKTGTLPWWLRLQLAGYRRRILAALKNVIIRPWGLELRKNGTYRLAPVFTFPGLRSADSERDFLSILRTAQLKRCRS